MSYNGKIVVDARMIVMSGIGRYIQALIPAFIKNFKNVVILGKSSEINKFIWAKEIELIEFNKPIYSISEQIGLFLKTPKCDAFISPHYNSPLWLPQAKVLSCIIPDTNHLVFANDLSLAKKAYAIIFYNTSARKNIVFTISEFSKREIIKYTKVDGNDIIVAKCAIDTDYFENLISELNLTALPKEVMQYCESPYILYIGNIKPHKNLSRSLLAFNSLSNDFPSLKFLIVGKKDNFLTADAEIFNLVKSSENLKKNVIFTGHITDLYLAYIFKKAEVFLFPSLYEGFGLPPLEAMFFGCPVIVSGEGSLPEICGNAAYYCNAYSVESISESLKMVLSTNILKNELIEKGRLKVKEYHWSEFTDIIISKIISNLSPSE